VHDPGPQLAADPREPAGVVEQRVDQRAVGVAGRRVDDQAGRLVDDDEVLVLEEDRQRDVLGDRAGRRGRRDRDLDDVAEAELGPRLRRRDAADRDVAVVDQPADLRAGQRVVAPGQGLGEERVEPGADGRDLEAELGRAGQPVTRSST
jgi:hypothetical protein